MGADAYLNGHFLSPKQLNIEPKFRGGQFLACVYMIWHFIKEAGPILVQRDCPGQLHGNVQCYK